MLVDSHCLGYPLLEKGPSINHPQKVNLYSLRVIQLCIMPSQLFKIIPTTLIHQDDLFTVSFCMGPYR